MNDIKFDYRSRCGIGFRHFLTRPDEMNGFWNPNVTHAHPHYEIFYLLKGKCTYSVGGKSYEVTPGDLIAIQAFQNHSISVDPSQDYERFVLEYEMTNIPSLNGVTPLFDCFSENIPALFIPKKNVDNSNLITIFETMEKICREKNKFTNHLLLAEVIKLVTVVRMNYDKAEGTLEIPTSKNSKYETCLNKVSAYINANISKKITIDDIAKNIYLSRSYLQHMFKQYVGMSISEYIFKQKMHIARYMLQNGSSLTEVSEMLGYKYYSTFCQHYKKYYGTSPKNHG